jgi:hypothetical protein
VGVLYQTPPPGASPMRGFDCGCGKPSLDEQ